MLHNKVDYFVKSFDLFHPTNPTFSRLGRDRSADLDYISCLLGLVGKYNEVLMNLTKIVLVLLGTFIGLHGQNWICSEIYFFRSLNFGQPNI